MTTTLRKAFIAVLCAGCLAFALALAGCGSNSTSSSVAEIESESASAAAESSTTTEASADQEAIIEMMNDQFSISAEEYQADRADYLNNQVVESLPAEDLNYGDILTAWLDYYRFNVEDATPNIFVDGDKATVTVHPLDIVQYRSILEENAAQAIAGDHESIAAAMAAALESPEMENASTFVELGLSKVDGNWTFDDPEYAKNTINGMFNLLPD